MKSLNLVLICFGFSFVIHHTETKTPIHDQEIEVTNLIERIIGKIKTKFFVVRIHNASAGMDQFSIAKINNTIHIDATTAVVAANGFHYYLKKFCNSHVSWDYDRIKLPDPLPDVNITVSLHDKYRYYQNVCTYSYSYVWWDSKRWRREIDWMALNGINIALAFTGQEAIWKRVYENVGLTNAEINEYFAGSAFLAWNRMGNIKGWRGPLTDEWHTRSLKLQSEIIKNMKRLSIIPILPAFAGFVPAGLKRLYPSVKFHQSEKWCDFPTQYCCIYLLDPQEELFKKIGTLFLKVMIAEFGTGHYYNCDPFNEITPPYSDLNYLRNMSASIYNTMVQVDPESIWILQGWFFVNDVKYWTISRARAFLSGVPDDGMIILDLQSEFLPQFYRLKSYFGKPFIWCMLHNFGGTSGMHGSFDILNSNIIEARNANNTMIGIGLTPEGINQNYIIYDFMMESIWRSEEDDTDVWIKNYSERRYGNSASLKKAWLLLKNSLYNYKLIFRVDGQYTLCLRPSLKHVPWVWYNVSDVFVALQYFLNATNEIIAEPNFEYDLVDLTRQVLQILFDKMYNKMVRSYLQNNSIKFEYYSNLLLAVLRDMDRILATSDRYMLGSWLQQAHQIEPNSGSFYEQSARIQITLWGPKGEILDYATKQWSGVVEDYYIPRWKLFVRYLNQSLTSHTKYDQHKFNQDIFYSVEVPFTTSVKNYPTIPNNKSFIVARDIYNFWHKFMNTVQINQTT